MTNHHHPCGGFSMHKMNTVDKDRDAVCTVVFSYKFLQGGVLWNF